MNAPPQDRADRRLLGGTRERRKRSKPAQHLLYGLCDFWDAEFNTA
jgi:hypothetical protein